MILKVSWMAFGHSFLALTILWSRLLAHVKWPVVPLGAGVPNWTP